MNKIRDENGQHSPLGSAIFKANVDIVKLLLKYGADIHCIVFNGIHSTAVYLACKRNNMEIVQLLLDMDQRCISTINEFLPEKNGDTVSCATSPLCVACRHNNLDMVKLQIQNGAKVICDDCGYYPAVPCPMVHAIYHGSIELLRLLLDNTQLPLEIGYGTMLHHPLSILLYFASQQNKQEAVQLLLDNGAFWSKGENNPVYSPLCVACANDNLEMAQFLIQRGARIIFEGGTYPM